MPMKMLLTTRSVQFSSWESTHAVDATGQPSSQSLLPPPNCLISLPGDISLPIEAGLQYCQHRIGHNFGVYAGSSECKINQLICEPLSHTRMCYLSSHSEFSGSNPAGAQYWCYHGNELNYP
jgi:hypothetical protein